MSRRIPQNKNVIENIRMINLYKHLTSIILLLCISYSCNIYTQPEKRGEGCDENLYPDPEYSEYVLPVDIGTTFYTGLTNCSGYFHGPDQPDKYAFDFDLPEGTKFYAAREGKVYAVEENFPSEGGDIGNYVIIKHYDNTYAYYAHSPKDGIIVDVGEKIKQGQELGIVGMSGYAGYPHLHFIVVEGDPRYPYSGVAVSFRNVEPADRILKSHTKYTSLIY